METRGSNHDANFNPGVRTLMLKAFKKKHVTRESIHDANFNPGVMGLIQLIQWP